MADERRRPEPFVVTSAPPSRAAELDAKRRHYAITMIARVALIGIAVAFLRPWPWVLYPAMVVAMVLPYIAVVLANSLSGRTDGDVEPFERDPAPTAIRSGRTIDPD
ncbi:MAG TPA: DUF3099 domain-containing protein [Mycobacteriales bacterium]